MQAVGAPMTRVPTQPRASASASRAAALSIDTLFREHASFVWRVLKRLNVPPADVDDALQEVFLIVARKLEHYEDRGSIKAWLFTIARQVALHARRSHGRSEQRKAQAMLAAENLSVSSPEERATQRQAAELVRWALSQIDPDQAMVFYLAEVEGFTVPEIAVSLDVNLNTVYGRLRLSRKRIESLLRESDLYTGDK